MGRYVSPFAGATRIKSEKENKKYISPFGAVKKKTDPLTAAGYVVGKAGLGVGGVVEGVADLAMAGIDITSRGDTRMAEKRFLHSVTGEAEQALTEKVQPGAALKFVGDAASGVGQSSTFLLNAVVPGLGTGLFFAGVGSQGISSAAQQTGEVGAKEIGYGVASGATEAILEKLLGAGGQAAGKLASGLAKKGVGMAAQKGLSTTLTRAAGKGMGKTLLLDTAKAAGGEFAEEFSAEYIDTGLQRLFGIDPNATTSFKEALYAGAVGAVSGGVMGAPASLYNYRSSVEAGRAIRTEGGVDSLLSRAKATVEVLKAQETRYREEAKTKAPVAEGAEKATKKAAVSQWLTNRGSASQATKTKEYAEKLEKNVDAYEGLADNIRNSEVGDALLGELRGNLYFTNYAYAVEEVEEALSEMTDEQTAEAVSLINEEAAKAGWKKTDYTVEDFRNNVDGIRSQFAGLGLSEQIVKGAWTEEDEQAARAAQEAAEEAEAYEGAEEESGPAESRAEAEKQTTTTKRGRVTLNLSEGKQMRDLSETAYAAYNASRILSEALGTNIVLHETLGTIDGKKENGYYNKSKGEIHVALDAGRDANGTALFTLAHEVTHYIRVWSPDKYQALADFVNEKMGENLDGLVEAKLKTLRSMETFASLSESELREMAHEEVVADSMETVLTDGKVLEELAAYDKSLWDKIREWITEALEKLKAAYADLKPNSQAARVLAETMDSLEEMERLFTEGVREAGEKTKEEAVTRMNEEKMHVNEEMPFSVEDPDTAYLAAVERGDMETAQKMVDEAAKAAGWNPVVRYHQTAEDFTVFDPKHTGAGTTDFETPFGIFIKPTDSDIGLKGQKQMALYANIRKPLEANDRADLVEKLKSLSQKYAELLNEMQSMNEEYKSKIDDAFNAWPSFVEEYRKTHPQVSRREILLDAEAKKVYDEPQRLTEEWTKKSDALAVKCKEEINKTLKDNGYDGVHIREDAGSGGRNTETYIALDPEQVKSADPVTYDDNGNVIPLSERFKEDNPDIRYSIDETTETPDVSENPFVAAVRRMEEETAKTEKLQMQEAAGEISGRFGIKPPAELTAGMERLLRSAIEKDFETVERGAEELALAFVENLPDMTETDPYMTEVYKTLHGVKIKLSEAQMREIMATRGSFENFRRSWFGRGLYVSKTGVPLDTLWVEWSEQYPDLFSDEVVETDQPDRLELIMRKVADSRTVEVLADERETAREVSDSIIQAVTEKAKEERNTNRQTWRRMVEDHLLIAEGLMQTVRNEEEYRTIKRYRAKAEELADAELRVAELRKKTAETNRQLDSLNERIKGVPKGQREPWVLTELDEVKARKKAYMDEMDELNAKLEKEIKRLLSGEAARPLRRMMAEVSKKANAEVRRAQRAQERAERKADESREKYEQKSRTFDARKATVARQKETRRIMARLNTMLYNPTRKNHLPYGTAMAVKEVLESTHVGDLGQIKTHMAALADVERSIEALERKPVRTEREEERLQKLYSKREHLEVESLSARQQAQDLVKIYRAFGKSTDENTKRLYDAETAEMLQEMVDSIEDEPVAEMSLESLRVVEELYRRIYHMVTTANNLFASERAETIDTLGKAAKAETDAAKSVPFLSPKAREVRGLDGVRRFFWANMKPLTVFEVVGSDTLTGLFRAVMDGETVWARDIEEARAEILKAKETYGYDKWDLRKRTEITDKEGKKVSLTVGEAMSLWAYTFRPQALSHLTEGGFKLDPYATETAPLKNTKLVVEQALNDQTRYVLDEDTVGQIGAMLTDEQKAYAREMQKYITQMGEKGNEVSRKLYGIDIFTEEEYFPIKVSKDYLESQTGRTGDPKIKNRGMTKETVPDANNPLVLQDVMAVVTDHINSMATYHAFVLPVEDLMRVIHYQPTNAEIDEDGNWTVAKEDKDNPNQFSTLKAAIVEKYGNQAIAYIEQLIRDLNGGARRDAAASILDKGLAAFKRASTMASLSVIIQQPTSMIRAMAYIDGKYFAGAAGIKVKDHARLWEELKEYAGVAVIKEMGGYDTGVGARTGEFLNSKEYKTWKEKAEAFFKPELYGGDKVYRAEVFGKGAAYADEMAWIQIFDACKREQAEALGLPIDSEKVKKAAAERFTEVIRKTQVYDSTLSRSEYMRSKDTGAKMATAFMAEPSTIVSMMIEGAVKADRGDKTFARRTYGAVAASVIANAIMVSLVYALRDNDEEKTYGEKYMASLVAETMEAVNPLEYLPYARDVMSIMKGYEVERSDMALIAQLFQSLETITSSKRSVGDKVATVSGAVASFFGVPLRNIYRDAKGLTNTFARAFDPEAERGTAAGMGEAALSAIQDNFGIIYGLFGEDVTNADRLYRATVRGDEAQVARIRSRYASDKAAEQALRKALREEDERIAQAAEARHGGNLEAYEAIVEEMEAEGIFDRDIIIRAINNELNDIIDQEAEKLVPVAEDAEELPTEEPASESMYSVSDLTAAMERGDSEDTATVLDSLTEDKMAAGQTEAQARATVRSSVTRYWKSRYLTAWEANDTEEMRRIRRLLTSTGLYGDEDEVNETVSQWIRAS